MSPSNLAASATAARHIQEALPHEDVGSLPLTVSIGVASLYETVHAWEPLVTSADVAMYEAERSGKNCIMSTKPV